MPVLRRLRGMGRSCFLISVGSPEAGLVERSAPQMRAPELASRPTRGARRDRGVTGRPTRPGTRHSPTARRRPPADTLPGPRRSAGSAPRFGSRDLLNGEPVGPVVAEVVQVAEPVPRAEQAEQLGVGLVSRLWPPSPDSGSRSGGRRCRTRAGAVGPGHRRLHHLLQHRQTRLARHLHMTPHRRLVPLPTRSQARRSSSSRSHEARPCSDAVSPPATAGPGPPLLKRRLNDRRIEAALCCEPNQADTSEIPSCRRWRVSGAPRLVVQRACERAAVVQRC
jgi:hypothetical protein